MIITRHGFEVSGVGRKFLPLWGPMTMEQFAHLIVDNSPGGVTWIDDSDPEA